MSNLNEYLDFAKELAGESGKIMLEYFGQEENGLETKQDNTPVTDADKKINSLVVNQIVKTFPGHGVLGEEESHEGSSEYVWVCDPIDGTRPFTYGIPISTFNLALTKDGKSLVAVQYDPYMDRLYSAALGQGAHLNGQRMHMTDRFTGRIPVNLEIYLGPNSIATDPHAETKAKDALSSEEWYLMKLGSIGYSIGRVACDQYGAAVFSGGGPYEAATGNLLITEAGGKFTNIFGEVDSRYDQPTNGFIAAHPTIHERLLESLAPIASRYEKRQ